MFDEMASEMIERSKVRNVGNVVVSLIGNIINRRGTIMEYRLETPGDSVEGIILKDIGDIKKGVEEKPMGSMNMSMNWDVGQTYSGRIAKALLEAIETGDHYQEVVRDEKGNITKIYEANVRSPFINR